VGRPSTAIQTLTLLLTALLAWPWNIVLSAAESSQLAGPDRVAVIETHSNPRLPRMMSLGWWKQQSRPEIAPDFDRDEESGDDESVLPLSSDFAPLQAHRRADAAASSSLVCPLLLASVILRQTRRRLRC